MQCSCGVVAGLILALVGAPQVFDRPLPRNLVGTSFEARVTHVVDGDTLEVTAKEGQLIRIRLDGVDSPEAGRPFSRVATNFVRSIAFDRTVVVRGTNVDRYNRLVARVLVGSSDVSLELVKAGLAWHFVCYSNDAQLADAERRARQARRGFWVDSPVRPPWDCTSQRSAAGVPVGPFKGNVSSRVYHAANCRHAACKNCTAEFKTQDEARAAGYRPAGDCLARHRP